MTSLNLQKALAALPTADCVQWEGRVTADGYPRGGRGKGNKGTHRLIYEMLVGEIPVGHELDHICHNEDASCTPSTGGCLHRRCVNPAHLRVVTHAENIRSSWPARKTECSKGHPFDEKNTYIRASGWRTCRRCMADAQVRMKARRNAA